jgi:nucleotide-binding universal stress UspA family protein
MEKIQRILAGTDFSPRGGRALRRAAQLAHEHGAALYLLHVLPAFPFEAVKRLMVETPPETEQKLYAQAKAALQQETEALATQGIVIRQHVAIGRGHVEINHYADTHQIDLVVIGDRGESFVQELFLGTTASKTLRTGGRPLLITKQEPKEPYNQVLVPVDFSRNSLDALEFACKVAKEASIYALHAIDIPFEKGMERHAGLYEEWVDPYRDEIVNRAHEEMHGIVEEYGARHIRIKPLIEHGSPSAIIREKTAALDIDLIVIGKRGETELDDTLLGSVTKHVLYETTCDVLVVSPPPAPHQSR